MGTVGLMVAVTRMAKSFLRPRDNTRLCAAGSQAGLGMKITLVLCFEIFLSFAPHVRDDARSYGMYEQRTQPRSNWEARLAVWDAEAVVPLDEVNLP